MESHGLYEDIKNYINDRNSIENSNSNSTVTAGKASIEVDPPKQDNSIANQQEEFNKRLAEKHYLHCNFIYNMYFFGVSVSILDKI